MNTEEKFKDDLETNHFEPCGEIDIHIYYRCRFCHWEGNDIGRLFVQKDWLRGEWGSTISEDELKKTNNSIIKSIQRHMEKNHAFEIEVLRASCGEVKR